MADRGAPGKTIRPFERAELRDHRLRIVRWTIAALYAQRPGGRGSGGDVGHIARYLAAGEHLLGLSRILVLQRRRPSVSRRIHAGLEMTSRAPNKQFEPTVIRRHVRAASAPFHYAHAARWTARRAAAQLRR